MASLFVIIRKDFLDLLPGRNSDSVKQCAAALLNFFRNQRQGWLTINIPQFSEILFEQWGKEAIRKALELLSDEALIERKHHRLNGRAWQYRLPQRIKVMPAVIDPDEATIAPDEDSDASDEGNDASKEESVTPSRATSIYKDPLENHFSDQQQDPAAASTVDLEIQIKEIEKICCTPNIEIAPVVEAMKKNPENVAGAIAYTKNCIRTWDGRRQFNWTGVLIKAIRAAQTVPAVITNQNDNNSVPPAPEGFAKWAEASSSIKTIFYSTLRSEWVAIYQSGLQRPWYEAMGVQP